MTLRKQLDDLEERANWSEDGATLRLPGPVPPVPVKTPADVIALVAEQVNAVRADVGADPLDRAKTIGFLAGVGLRAMEQGDALARMEAVERVLKLRKDMKKD